MSSLAAEQREPRAQRVAVTEESLPVDLVAVWARAKGVSLPTFDRSRSEGSELEKAILVKISP